MRLAELTDQAIDYIVTNMDDKALSQWEREFFENTADTWQRTRKLTDKWKLKLGEIWDKQP